nr:MAG TPA: hypothetical protein [Caudoviricetes sp.]
MAFLVLNAFSQQFHLPFINKKPPLSKGGFSS